MARLFKSPISTHWQSLAKWQAVALVFVGIILEIPVRWIVRPDIPYMLPVNPWFNLPLRIAIEVGFVLVILPLASAMKISYRALGIPRRRWTRWEWIAFVVVGAIELAVVISIAGHRWPKLFAAGVFGRALLWVFAEFFFGFNQEFIFRGVMMTGLLRLTTPLQATLLNTFLFLIGPLHGPGLWMLAGKNPVAATWMLAGVVATGLFFSWLRYRSDNVVLCGLLHGLVNGFLNGAAFARRAYL
ncbi:CPBP family intramembrane metalloprotease [candidate division KSB1 bacterium]|nr:CPBP family intramembrane metalloprotease [candidate division KSB1 bacterium]